MKKLTENIKKNWLFYLIIFISVFVFWMPYLGKNFTNGAEIKFHYARVMTLADCLKQGIFPAKLRPMHMKLYGYGIGFFYPDLLIYPPAALIALGADYEIVIKIYEFIIILIGAFLTYDCFVKLSGKREIAVFGEILFMESLINDENLFWGGGMPHLFAFMFLPLAICGLLSALKDERQGYIRYVIGMTMVLMTHNMIFLTMMFAMIIIVLFHAKEIGRKPSILIKLLGVSFAAMAVTTAYWLPAMEQILHIDFIAFHDNAYKVNENILSFGQLFFEEIGAFFYSIFVLAVIAFVVLLARKRRFPKDIVCMLVVNILTLWLMCSNVLWNSSVGEALNFFEYTERFDFVVTVTMVIFIVMTLRELFDEFNLSGILEKSSGRIGFIVLSFAVMLTLRFLARPDFYTCTSKDRIELYKDLLMEDYQVSGAEWLPKECEPSECKTPNTSYDNEGGSADGFKHDDAKYYEVWVNFEREYYDVPYVYYYGYEAYIIDDNNNPIQSLEVSEAFDDNGYVRVSMPKDTGGVGHIMVTYRKTTIQKIAYIISILSIIAVISFVLAYRRRKVR